MEYGETAAVENPRMKENELDIYHHGAYWLIRRDAEGSRKPE